MKWRDRVYWALLLLVWTAVLTFFLTHYVMRRQCERQGGHFKFRGRAWPRCEMR